MIAAPLEGLKLSYGALSLLPWLVVVNYAI